MITQAFAYLAMTVLILALIGFLAYDALQSRRDTLMERNLSEDLERELMSYGADEGTRNTRVRDINF